MDYLNGLQKRITKTDYKNGLQKWITKMDYKNGLQKRITKADYESGLRTGLWTELQTGLVRGVNLDLVLAYMFWDNMECNDFGQRLN